MRLPGIKTARKLARWLQLRTFGGALVLGYHRIAEVACDPYGVNVTPKNFEAHMAALRAHAHPVSITRLVEGRRDGTLRPGSVAVTFDDGYSDVLQHAKPILDRYEIPASAFVCTGSLGEAFWWDELTRQVWTARRLPGRVELAAEGCHFQQDVPDSSESTRKELLDELYAFFAGLPFGPKGQLLKQVRDRFNAQGRMEARAMTPEELWQLITGGQIEVGSHSATHPHLARLSPGDQDAEIAGSKATLESILQRQVAGFSYPHGSYSAETARLVRRAGYAYACQSHGQVVIKGDDVYALPRFWPPDWAGQRFSSWLERWI